MSITLVDTDILIDSALQVEQAIRCLDDMEQTSDLGISAITQMELIVGCRNKTELRKMEQFLQRFQVYPVTEQISSLATDLLEKYRLSHGLLIPDALIASTALSLDCNFITKNQRDYQFIRSLRLLSYP
ncbi:MAG: type II toxin-antitoxin system VapC family toxin [Chloroflexi bacterium]|nr:type II toxin-antitoxin system VapC family toxin [Chloroflexota bacterium]